MRKVLYPFLILMVVFSCNDSEKKSFIMTVKGPVTIGEAGVTLTHEHILVDFIGADSVSSDRWEMSEVMECALPFLKEIKALGCQTFMECTPAYLGRDPLLLKSLSDSTGLNIITNTGYYGAVNNKFLPDHAFTETADQLAERWISEWEDGIDGTGIKPGFIKIGVARDSLSEIHKKLVVAAARTHLKTGLVIASHTGPVVPALQQITVLQEEDVSPEAFIWVHAQSEENPENHIKAAQSGAWISFDGLNDNDIQKYLELITNMKENNLLGKVLLSHDAGWYRPGEINGGNYRGYTVLFEKLVPLLRENNFSDEDIDRLLVKNPANAFGMKRR
jgi:phosphotriesterase-related protein